MSKSIKKNKKLSHSGRMVLWGIMAVIALLALLTVVAAINANTLHVRKARVILPDLPASFEGRTLLYASDIDLCGMNTPEKSAALFAELQSLNPDILVLGGDYTSVSLFDALNIREEADRVAKQQAARTRFFQAISRFNAPLGRFVIAAPEDPDSLDLETLAESSGFTPLFNRRESISVGGERLWLCGIASEDADINAGAKGFLRGDCVIAVCANPSPLPRMLTSEAGDSGAWFDLGLCGGTHGGQINLFGRSALRLSREARQYLCGWRVENGIPILTTSGVGCEGANLRLGSGSEVWLITLTGAAE